MQIDTRWYWKVWFDRQQGRTNLCVYIYIYGIIIIVMLWYACYFCVKKTNKRRFRQSLEIIYTWVCANAFRRRTPGGGGCIIHKTNYICVVTGTPFNRRYKKGIPPDSVFATCQNKLECFHHARVVPVNGLLPSYLQLRRQHPRSCECNENVVFQWTRELRYVSASKTQWECSVKMCIVVKENTTTAWLATKRYDR